MLLALLPLLFSAFITGVAHGQKNDSTPETASSSVHREFILIPGGEYRMGDAYAERNQDERPVHPVNIGAFYMGSTEVAYALWQDVYRWALRHGYGFDNPGSGKAPDHPVHSVNWYDMIKWCNARSEKDGLTPVYYTDETRSDAYRTGRLDISNSAIRWDADGYRLPTEAEWEKASRAGKSGRRFPWGDTVTHRDANYTSEGGFAFDLSETTGVHPDYNQGEAPYTSPAGSFPPNAFMLYDISGNVWEVCWDWYDPQWYRKPEATEPDPHGPDVPADYIGAEGGGFKPNDIPYRSMRGGGWESQSRNLRCAVRDHFHPAGALGDAGFRLARSKL